MLLNKKQKQEHETFLIIKAQLEQKELQKKNDNENKKFLRDEINLNLRELNKMESQRTQILKQNKKQYLQDLVYQMNKRQNRSSNNLSVTKNQM